LMSTSVSTIDTLAAGNRDRLLEENIALVNRLGMLRSVLERSANENAQLRRRLARLRAENRQLRTELDEREASPSMVRNSDVAPGVEMNNLGRVGT
jgi:predicted nuclease with TOPRIM domain